MPLLATIKGDQKAMTYVPKELLESVRRNPSFWIRSHAPEELLSRLSPKERVAGLSPEERLAGLSASEIRAYLKQLLSEQAQNGS